MSVDEETLSTGSFDVQSSETPPASLSGATEDMDPGDLDTGAEELDAEQEESVEILTTDDMGLADIDLSGDAGVSYTNLDGRINTMGGGIDTVVVGTVPHTVERAGDNYVTIPAYPTREQLGIPQLEDEVEDLARRVDDFTGDAGAHDLPIYFEDGETKEIDALKVPGDIESTNGGVSAHGIADLTAGGGGVSDYEQLVNKPRINGHTLDGNMSTEDLGIDIPDRTSDLINDSGYVTQTDIDESVTEEQQRAEAAEAALGNRIDDVEEELSQAGAALDSRISDIEGKETGWDAKYDKPADGIPNSDLQHGSVTIGSTEIALGETKTSLEGIDTIDATGRIFTEGSVVGDSGVVARGIADLTMDSSGGQGGIDTVVVGTVPYGILHPGDTYVTIPAYPTKETLDIDDLEDRVTELEDKPGIDLDTVTYSGLDSVTTEDSSKTPTAYAAKRMKDDIGIDELTEFDEERAYTRGDLCKHGGKGYRFTAAKAAGAWDPSYCDRLTYLTLAQPLVIPKSVIDALNL